MQRLQLVQNQAARLISQADRYANMETMFKELHWLPIERRIVFKLLVLVHNALNNKAPQYISDLFSVYTPSRCLRSQHELLLVQHKTNNSYGDKAFMNSGPNLWNRLPPELRTETNQSNFKKKLKTFLFY